MTAKNVPPGDPTSGNRDSRGTFEVPAGGVIDTMMGLPAAHRGSWRDPLLPLLRDTESRETFEHAAGYMFRDLPDTEGVTEAAPFLLEAMDAHRVQRGLVPVSFEDERARTLVSEHPGRFSGTYLVDPHAGQDGVDALRRAAAELGVVAAVAFPCGYVPQVPVNDHRMFPLYEACVDLGLPICINAGVPGPRVPMAPQHVELFDELCWAYPDLTVVMRHGGAPWFELAVMLLRKWPNLYYSTSAYAPRRYPEEILAFANGSGADKVIFAGYFPAGLTLDRIFAELAEVPLAPAVWPKFLRANALRVFSLDDEPP
ncbi:MAG TPA: amidohydrolase family protein [Acidimicrobiales bacterium]|nr:amidohydrolase family protein [Acidimicrobiales bacterium]